MKKENDTPKYFTPDQVKERAKISDKDALAVSIEHWEQLISMSARELESYREGILTSKYCGLCYRYNFPMCKACILKRHIGGCSEKATNPYIKTRKSFNDLVAFPKDEKLLDIFRANATIMLEKLKEIYSSVYEEK